MTNFADFNLREIKQVPETVCDLADGLLPEMADRFGVALRRNDLVSSMEKLIGALGESSLLQENVGQVRVVLGEDEDGLAVAVDWAERSGIQNAMNRSLWLPGLVIPSGIQTVVMTGAVENWQRRMAGLLEQHDWCGQKPKVFIEASNKGEGVTQAAFAESHVVPRLEGAGYTVNLASHDEGGGSEIAKKFAEAHPEFFEAPIAFVRVANGGVQLAGQFIRAARSLGIPYDQDSENPQGFVLTDSFPIASSREQLDLKTQFQNPETTLRQIPQVAKNLLQLVGVSR